MVAPLQIYLLAETQETLDKASAHLDADRYVLHAADLAHVDPSLADADPPVAIDCLIVESAAIDDPIQQRLTASGMLVPMVVLSPPGLSPADQSDLKKRLTHLYHDGIVTLALTNLSQLEAAIHRAIQQFLSLSAESCALPQVSADSPHLPIPDLLSAQQKRLTDKLKARLGYLGVYYKRNPDFFLRNMSQADRDTLLNQLRTDYRRIVLGYFADDPILNQNIDTFVDQAFMADISVSYIVEIHMDLMDEFSKQLKLEGRSEEILLDYRLTLIDVIAHLCEMYRRSIPREP